MKLDKKIKAVFSWENNLKIAVWAAMPIPLLGEKNQLFNYCEDTCLGTSVTIRGFDQITTTRKRGHIYGKWGILLPKSGEHFFPAVAGVITCHNSTAIFQRKNHSKKNLKSSLRSLPHHLPHLHRRARCGFDFVKIQPFGQMCKRKPPFRPPKSGRPINHPPRHII